MRGLRGGGLMVGGGSNGTGAVSQGAEWWPEEGDDRWGPPVSPARRGAKAARGEAFFP
jgi:hypothetical protein